MFFIKTHILALIKHHPLMLKFISKHHTLLTLAAFTCLFVSCEQKNLFSDLTTCKEIENYPTLYSYKTESLMASLQAKATVALVDSQLDTYFTKDAFDNPDYTKEVLYGGEFKVYPLNKIVYANATVIVYLIKEIEEKSLPELDMIVLVMYDNAGKPVDIVYEYLIDSFGTREVNITSPTDFEVLWIDDEYSVDPESEADDIARGYVNVPILITTTYTIDTLELKIIETNSWQEDLPVDDELEEETDTESNDMDDPNQFCFESTSPNAMKATPLYEYLKITCIDDSVWGVGAGDFTQGSQPWTLSFSGKLTKEKNMKLSVTYNQEDEETFTTSEVWTLDLENNRLYRKEWKNSDNQMGASEYHRIGCSEIPGEYGGKCIINE